MTHPLQFALGALLALGLALPAAADEVKKASTPKVVPVPAATGGTLTMTKPDLVVLLTDRYIFAMNLGGIDYVGPLDIGAGCRSTAPNAPVSACGASFPGGIFNFHVANFPHGHGQLPTYSSGPNQQTSGSGWLAIPLGLPPGTFEVTAMVDVGNKVDEKDETNNKAHKTITISPPPPPGVTLNVPNNVFR